MSLQLVTGIALISVSMVVLLFVALRPDAWVKHSVLASVILFQMGSANVALVLLAPGAVRLSVVILLSGGTLYCILLAYRLARGLHVPS